MTVLWLKKSDMRASPEQIARDSLRARQGPGARYDAPNAPHEALILARRGTAYFSRKLNELRDEELDAPSLVKGWSRRHIIAQVSYHARALARLGEGISTGIPALMYESIAMRDAQILLGATLPARALRTLFHHTEVHLNVIWRDLSDNDWSSKVTLLDGQNVSLPETVWLRASEVWGRSVELNNGGSKQDFPAELRR